MAANIPRAVKALRDLYELPFGSKRRGRFVLTREQLGRMLNVKKLHDSTIVGLQIDALEEENLVVAELADQLYGIMDATVVAGWRRVPKRNLSDVLDDSDSGTSDDIETHEDGDDDE
jgi:hypothetical protein